MKNVILAIDAVSQSLVNACQEIEKTLNRKIYGIRLISQEYRNLPSYKEDKSGLFKEIIVDYDDKKSLQKIFIDLKESILTVSCDDEASVQSFKKIIPFLPNIVLPNESTLIWATEKNHMRNMLSSYDETLVPRYIEVNRLKLDESLNELKKLKFPVIIKPCGLHTSMLVQKCDNYDDLSKILESTYAIIDEIYSKNLGNGTATILVEEFINGDMYSVDAYVSSDGENITFLPAVRVVTSHEMGLKGFYGYDRILPSGLSKDEENQAQIATDKAIRALNLRATTAHVELYKTSTGWKIIELGARIGGSREIIYDLSYGIKHHYNDLALRIGGIKPIISYDPVATTICIHIYPEEEGTIEVIQGLDELNTLDTLKQLRVFAKKGDFAASSEVGGLLSAEIVLSGSNQEKVISDAKFVHRTIKVVVKK